MDVITKVSSEPDQKTTFFLTETRDAADLLGLPRSGGEFSAYAFRLSPSDVARFQALRSVAYDRQRFGTRVSIGLGVATKEFCRVASSPNGPLLATTYLKTSETVGYIVVTKDVDLADDKSLAEQLAVLGAC